MTYPFFGGPWDGEFHEADSDCWKVIASPASLSFPSRVVCYYKQRLILDGTHVTVYILEGLTTFDMFKMMLDKCFNQKKD